jgi:tRNA(Ser,Leu) C12 N-acetylase TAN1
VQEVEEEGQAKVIVTGRNAAEQRQTRRALRRAVRGSKVRSSGFTNVFLLEAPGDALVIAQQLTQQCADRIGHASAVRAETVSETARVLEAVVNVGLQQVGRDETFCFRLRKRGRHRLEAPTPEIEVQIGSALWLALQERDGERPGVKLKEPDVLVLAEVLGPTTAVGIVRKAWREAPAKPAAAEKAETLPQNLPDSQ